MVTFMRLRAAITAVMSAVLLATGMSTPAVAAQPSIEAVHCNDWTTFTFPDGNKLTLPSVGNNTGIIDCILAYGDQNPGVWILQAALNKCNSGSLTLDAIYGQQTKDLVTWWQAVRGVKPVDGIYGPITRRGAILWPGYWADGTFRWCVWVS